MFKDIAYTVERYRLPNFIFLFTFPAGANGDPHFKTLDGLDFSFNGLGEYALIYSTSFKCQSRTGRITTNGTLSDATVFVSVAAKQISPESDIVEMRLNSNSDIGK